MARLDNRRDVGGRMSLTSGFLHKSTAVRTAWDRPGSTTTALGRGPGDEHICPDILYPPAIAAAPPSRPSRRRRSATDDGVSTESLPGKISGVKTTMTGAARNLKVIVSIVQAILILMVDDFIRSQFPPDHLLHGQSVEGNLLTIYVFGWITACYASERFECFPRFGAASQDSFAPENASHGGLARPDAGRDEPRRNTSFNIFANDIGYGFWCPILT